VRRLLPLLAHSVSYCVSKPCPELGVKPTSRLSVRTSQFDPEQKSEIKIVRISDTGTSLESVFRSSNLFGRATTPFKPLGGVTPVNWVGSAYVS
jgi:hypothetical protein